MHLRIYERVKSTKILSSLHSPTSQVFPNISPQIIFFTKYISLFALVCLCSNLASPVIVFSSKSEHTM